MDCLLYTSLPPEVLFRFFLAVEDGDITCKAFACYGEKEYSVLDLKLSLIHILTFLHDGIRHRKIQIPKRNDIIPGTLSKGKRVGIKFKKLGYESILIGGVSADINR